MTELKETVHECFRLPTNKDIPVWRYMDLAKYLSMLDRRSLYFARATQLGDAFEGSTPRKIVLTREYIRANRRTDPALAPYKELPDEFFRVEGLGFKQMVQSYLISCWHMNEHESAAMWNLYSSSNEAICIRSTYRRLRLSLPQSIFVGEVNYIDYETQVFSIDNVLNFIMHKRLSFAHERELRAIFWEMHGTPEAELLKAQIEPGGIAIAVDLPTLIEAVYISPAAAPWFAELVEAMTAKCGFDFPVGQSSLSAAPLY
jgi:hypothetical protein